MFIVLWIYLGSEDNLIVIYCEKGLIIFYVDLKFLMIIRYVNG